MLRPTAAGAPLNTPLISTWPRPFPLPHIHARFSLKCRPPVTSAHPAPLKSRWHAHTILHNRAITRKPHVHTYHRSFLALPWVSFAPLVKLVKLVTIHDIYRFKLRPRLCATVSSMSTCAFSQSSEHRARTAHVRNHLQQPRVDGIPNTCSGSPRRGPGWSVDGWRHSERA